MKTIPSELIAPLNSFIENVNRGIEVYYKTQFPSLDAPKVGVCSIGAKYAKLTKFELNRSQEYTPRSTYCFVDLTTGNILKGTWKAPVKNGVRGNLKDANVLDKVTPYGVAYVGVKTSNTISSFLTT